MVISIINRLRESRIEHAKEMAKLDYDFLEGYFNRKYRGKGSEDGRPGKEEDAKPSDS